VMSMEFVQTEAAPKAVGPYSQAVKANGFVFTAGQVALDPVSGRLVEGGVEAETRQVLANLAAVLEAAGSGPGKVVKTTIYLGDITDFQAVNAVYAEFFGTHRPARSTVQAGALPLGAQVEIDAVALG
jgi:2-iminobutanoate/2-iminopropanoate deaminase